MNRHRRSVVPNKPWQPPSFGTCLGFGVFVFLMVGLSAGDALAQDCRLSLSQPRVDYGALRRTELLDEQRSGQPIILGKRTLQLNVVCTDPRAVALRFVGVPAGAQGFRFGRHGSFTLALNNAQVDGRAVELNTAQSTELAANGQLLPGHVLTASIGGVPLTGKRFSAQVEIDTYLPPDAFSVRNETSFEGQGHFEWLSGG